MAVRCSVATGNWLTAGTWGLVDATSYLNLETGVNSVGTVASANRSLAFTPGAITISAIAVKFANRTGTTGTFTIELWNNTDSAIATGSTVTINMADLNAATTAAVDGGWIVFKLASPIALTAAKAYMIQVSTSSATQISLFRDAVLNWCRMLITSTTGAPAAGDDLVVAGNYTGAGTSNSYTVTMDETAATDYGSNTTSTVTPALAICPKGTLTFKNTSAANPYLRLSGHLIVYQGGTLNIGDGSTAIPRDSVAVLEFDCAADGDFGLVWRDGATVNMYGLSRTSGKNVVSTKLNADFAGGLLTQGALTNMGLATSSAATATSLAGVEGSGISRLACGVADTAANSPHGQSSSATGSVTSTTQVVTVWLARGSGTNNRYVRLQYGSTQAATSPPTNGFYADIDLQAGTIGTCTASGNGTATSSAITAFGGGFICTIIGKASSGSLSPFMSINCCNASGVTSYAGDATQCFLYYGPQVYTASSLPSATLTVVDDTGWLSGDMYAVASTSRTFTDCEPGVLGSNATSTTLPAKQNLLVAHSGTTPTQAEIILVTRNVKIRATSSTLMTFATGNLPSSGELGSAVVHIEWCEFYYVGVVTAGKRGIEPVPVTGQGSFSMTYCSVHDTEVNGVYFGVYNTTNNITFSNNTFWKLSDTTGPGCQIASATSGTTITIDSNILLRTGNSTGWTLSDIGGTFTNNVVVGTQSNGFSFAEGSAAYGIFTGNVAHSNNAIGFSLSGAGASGTFGTPTAWRNTGSGITISGTVIDFVLDTPVLFGNTSSNISLNASVAMKMLSPTLSGDTTFATTNGIVNGTLNLQEIRIYNGDFSTVSGIKTAHTSADFAANSAPADWRFNLWNTKLGATAEVTGQANFASSAFISSQKHDQTAGLHKTWTRYGSTTNTAALSIDTVIYKTASPSLKMIPAHATSKLESAPLFQGFKVKVGNGQTATPSVYVRKSIASDTGGVLYAGNQPRLIQRANPALGQNSDVVVDTMSVADNSGTWEQLTAAGSAATDDGVFEYVVDCDGTSGAWVNVDDFSATVA